MTAHIDIAKVRIVIGEYAAAYKKGANQIWQGSELAHATDSLLVSVIRFS
jgi:hypothetical protein